MGTGKKWILESAMNPNSAVAVSQLRDPEGLANCSEPQFLYL